MANDSICTCGYLGSGITTRKYSSAGILYWNANEGANAQKLAVDSVGNIYIVTITTITKRNSNGGLIWTENISGDVWSIHIDSIGNIYTITIVQSSPKTVYIKKYDSSFILQWSKLVMTYSSPGANSHNVIWDSDGNTYFWWYSRPDYMLYPDSRFDKYDSDGNLTWSHYPVTSLWCWEIGLDGYIYGLGWYAGGDYWIRKYSLDGILLFEFSNPDWDVIGGDCIYSDSDGNIFTGGDKLRKWSSGGVLQWEKGTYWWILDLKVDLNGNVVTVGSEVDGVSIRKYSNAGTLLWTANTINTQYSIEFGPAVIIEEDYAFVT